MGGTTSSAIQIMSPEVRAHTPVHIPARSAYRGARRDERKRLRTRLPAEMCVCVRRRCEFDVWRPRDVWPLLPTREGAALESVRPCSSHGWVPPSPAGSEDLPERQERRRVPRCARPCARSHVRGPLVRVQHTDTFLRSRCADDAALIDTAATVVIAGVGSAVTAATAPPPVAAPLPLQRVILAPGLCAARDPAATREGRCARIMGVVLMGAVVGVD